MTKLSHKELDDMAMGIFYELFETLNPVQFAEVIATLAACTAFAGQIGGEDSDVGIDLIAKLARAKRRLLLARFQEKKNWSGRTDG